MSAHRNRVLQSHLGGWPRPQAESRRQRFLYTDVTRLENERIQQYCKDNKISVSQFLADLMLRDSLKPTAKAKQKIVVRLEFELTPQQLDRVEMLTRLHEKDSMAQFIRDILEPYLNVQRLHLPPETTTLRYYLSDEEHERVMKHLANKGISARNYAATLALKAIAKQSREMGKRSESRSETGRVRVTASANKE
jgi:hypothetical protein